MLRCKDVAKSLADTNFRDLTCRQRVAMLFHIVLCPVCGSFHRDVVKSHKNAREFCEQEEPTDAKLPAETKKDLQELINKHSEK